MGKLHFLCLEGYVVSHWRFLERYRLESEANPFFNIHIQIDPSFSGCNEKLPNADRRKPQLIFLVFQCLRYLVGQPSWLKPAPEPDVRVEQELHQRSTSQSLSSVAGAT